MEIAMAVDPGLAGLKAMRAAAPRSWPSKTKIETRRAEKQVFDVQAFFNASGVGRKVAIFGSRETVFTQGDPATSVLYIQEGAVKFTVINESGNEAVVGILGRGDFFGEGCLAGQLQRVSTASTITPSMILVIDKPQMIRLLHTEHALQDRFITHLLSRTMRIEDDLVDQLVNSVEKRLARTLLLLAGAGKPDTPEAMAPEISQETLAEMIGTTRSRVNTFMNKFRKLGFIEYGAKLQGLQINESLQTVLRDAESSSERIAEYRASRFDRKENRTQNSEFSHEHHGATKH
jgi:CRP/FNR family cyclic AMP-dependent transcriptional regulator